MEKLRVALILDLATVYFFLIINDYLLLLVIIIIISIVINNIILSRKHFEILIQIHAPFITQFAFHPVCLSPSLLITQFAYHPVCLSPYLFAYRYI